MLKTGREHLKQLKDGRVVYIGSERVDDVTTHPAFRNAARSMAAIYDMKAADAAFSYEENGEKFSAYFLKAKTKEDLQKRTLKGTRSWRLGHPRDIAAMVVFLLSDDGEWINGQVISVDGGVTLR